MMTTSLGIALARARRFTLRHLLAEADRRRQARYGTIVRWLALAPEEHILDIGCGGGRGIEQFNTINPIVGIDLMPAAGCTAANFQYVRGSALALPFPDRSFDIAYANSVIEHIPEPQDQAQMAAEIRRVGRRYCVQTPNRHFPVEPHYLLPLFQFLPARWQAWIADRWTPAAALGWYPRGYEHIRLLTRDDLAELFPGATIHPERVGPLVKSYVVVGGTA